MMTRAALEAAASRMFTAGDQFSEEVTIQNIFQRCAEELGLALEIDTDDLYESEHSLSRSVSTEFVETLTMAKAMDFACHAAVYVNFNELLWDIHEDTLIVAPAPTIAEPCTGDLDVSPRSTARSISNAAGPSGPARDLANDGWLRQLARPWG